ncbi:MAG: PAS domain-containing protein [Bryobacteraceae bacterium]
MGFKMLEEIEDQRKAVEDPVSGLSPFQKLQKVCKIYTDATPVIERALLDKKGMLAQLAEATEWVRKAASLGPKLGSETDPAKIAMLEEDWRIHINHAAITLRQMASDLRNVPADLVVEQKALRFQEQVASLAFLGALTMLLLFLNLKPSALKPAPSPWAPVSWAPLACQVSRDSLVVIDQEGVIRSVNPSAEGLLGKPAVELVGRTAASVVDVPRSETSETVHGIVRCPDGRKRKAELTAHPIRLRNRSGVLLCAREIADSPAQSGSSSAESAFVADLFRSCPAPLAVLNPDGHLIHWNEPCQSVLGLDPSTARQEPYWSVVLDGADAQTARQQWESVIKGDAEQELEQAWISSAGQRVKFRWSRSVLRASDGSVRYVLMIGVPRGAAAVALAA